MEGFSKDTGVAWAEKGVSTVGLCATPVQLRTRHVGRSRKVWDGMIMLEIMDRQQQET